MCVCVWRDGGLGWGGGEGEGGEGDDPEDNLLRRLT